MKYFLTVKDLLFNAEICRFFTQVKATVPQCDSTPLQVKVPISNLTSTKVLSVLVIQGHGLC